ncbi:MAG: hypothetical protein OHK0029_25330 [Armatimonadaceae bacterium]
MKMHHRSLFRGRVAEERRAPVVAALAPSRRHPVSAPVLLWFALLVFIALSAANHFRLPVPAPSGFPVVALPALLPSSHPELLAEPGKAQPPANAQSGRKWALLIGVAKYVSGEVNSLRSPTNNVNEMVTALEKLGFAKERIIAMTSDAPAASGLYPSSKNVIAQLTNLAKEIKPEDTFVLYFTGHHFTLDFDRNDDGVAEPNHYLATVNANPLNPTSLDATTLPLDLLRQKMAALPASQVLYILDAFYMDPTPGREDGNNPRSPAFSAQMKQVAEKTGSEARAGMPPANVAVYYSAEERERGWEDNEKRQSVFIAYLVDALSGKGANDKKQMTMDAIAGYVRESVKADWNIKNPRRQQLPELVSFAPADAPPLLLNPYRPGDVVEAVTGKVDTEARLVVKVGPPEAQTRAAVRVNGQLAENGEYTLNLIEDAEKDVEVAIIAPEFEGQVLKARLVRGKVVPLEVNLEPAAPAPPPVPTNGKDNAGIVKIPAGTFTMGSDKSDPFKERDEEPEHKVYTNAFWIYKYPVTVEQYEQFCLETLRTMPPAPPHNPNWDNKDHPMVNVRWEDAAAYAKWAGGRLPTEAEWERAARGDNSLKYPWGNAYDEDKIWGSAKTERGGTASVLRTSFIAESPFGVMDMVGNVWEWCADWYQPQYYRSSPSRNPEGPKINGLFRVLRGGSYLDKYAKEFRGANRERGGFRTSKPNWGFRVVLPVYATLRSQ